MELIAMKQADCALQIGGDNYSLDYGPPIQHLKLDNSLLLAKKPIILWGASVGPFSRDRQIEETMQTHLRKFALILARESETVKYLSSIGIQDNVRLVADPAFCMPPREPSMSDGLRRFLHMRPLGVNLSPLLGRFRHADRQAWAELARECLEAMLEAGIAPLLIVPHVLSAHDDDYRFLVETASALHGRKARIMILPPNYSAAEMKWAIAKCRAFVGARTHATIAALSSAVPTISIGYSQKARGINRDIYGDLDWLLPVGDLSPCTLLHKVEDILSQEHQVRESLQAAMPSVVARARSAAEYLVSSGIIRDSEPAGT